ncbi:MAG: cation diffusion facilitator family transporter [Gammaproteobacteria bacterium]|nr:cation diffusion facilitator family transporter [Gammaproteobacteria bacterium]
MSTHTLHPAPTGHHAHAHNPTHAHGHDHHGTSKRLIFALILTLVFAVVEALGGWLADSLALLGDAGHMVSDASALGLAALGAWLAKRPPTLRHSYGLLRAEVLTALINGALLLVVAGNLAWHAIQRLSAPHDINAVLTMGIAALGLVVNIVVARALHGDAHDLNLQGAWLHVMGDLLGSVAALISGAVVYFYGWMWMDPLLSLLICVLIGFSSINLLRDVTAVVLEGVPAHLQLDQVGYAMAAVEGVHSVHDLHIWTLGAQQVMLSAHVVVADLAQWPTTLARLTQLLHAQYAIAHITLQPELGARIVWHAGPKNSN